MNEVSRSTDKLWNSSAETYANHIADAGKDSYYLRTHGLQPAILDLAGDCSDKRVLDVGCASGWLLDALLPAEGFGCDLHHYQGFSSRWNFRCEDLCQLSYDDDLFDITVASLVLIWIGNLNVALTQIRRVTKLGGRIVIALMHPHFYRTGEVDSVGNFVLTRSLASSFEIEQHKIAGLVGPFRYHYRAPSEYINACIQNELRIEEVRDWHIDLEEFESKFGSSQPGNIRRTGKVPMYYFISCRKV